MMAMNAIGTGVTVMARFPMTPSTVALMVTGPGEAAVIKPALLTDAMFASLEL